MATFTLVPLPRLGITPEGGMLINTYAAGGSSPAPTYQDSNGFATNTNPVEADGNGLFPAIYLPLGTAYKFVCTHRITNALPANPISNLGVVIWTQDGIASVSASSPAVDIQGTAGETLAANDGTYLSDGSGGKIAGLFYKWDAANAYSSSLPSVVGIATSAIPSMSIGSFRVQGTLTGFSSLSVLGNYYVGTAGALSAGPGTRLVGVADTTTSIIIGAPNLSQMDLLQIEAFL